jgi:hypothetical protein
MLAEASAHQREIAPEAAEALRAGELSPFVEEEVRTQAVTILDNYAAGRFTEPGFENVPLSFNFGIGALPDSVSAFATCRVPVLASPHEFGLRPKYPENRANYVAALAVNGLGTDKMTTFNTGSTGHHVAVVSHSGPYRGGLVEVEGRMLPADGEGHIRSAEAVVVTDPNNRRGLIGANGDNPIVVGTADSAMVMVNGAWNNLAAGVDLTTHQKLAELGLLEGPVSMAVGPGAQTQFDVRLQKLHDQSEARREFDGDPVSYEGSLLPISHADPNKVYLGLAHWAEETVGAIANGNCVSLDLCTVRDSAFLHSSRVQRQHPTIPGQMADGDRGMTALVPRSIQRKFR